MKNRSIWRHGIIASIALMTSVFVIGAAKAQMDQGPKTDKIYGIGLPRDHASQLFSDRDYPVFPLKPGQEVYKDIDGARMKRTLSLCPRSRCVTGTRSTSSGGVVFPVPKPIGLA